MKKELYVSAYKNNVLAKRGKILLAVICDYFLVFILGFILFIGFVTPINASLPVYKSNLNNINLGKEKLNQIVGSTHIQEYDEESKSLIDIKVTGHKYLEALTKTSYFIFNEKYPYKNENGIYEYKDVSKEETLINVENNNLVYYFINFKSNHDDLNSFIYEEKNYENNKYEYLKALLSYDTYNLDKYFISETEFNNLQDKYNLTNYEILNKDTSKLLMNYYAYNDSSNSINEIINGLLTRYYETCNYGVNDIENNYSLYKNTYNKDFIPYYNSYLLSLVISNLISYVLSFIVLEIIIPLCFKKNKTSLGNRILKLALERKDLMEPTYLNLSLYKVSRFLIFFSSNFLSLLFIGQLGVILYDFGLGVSYFEFLLFSFGLSIVSLIFFFINKDRQLLSNLVSFTTYKNIEEFENVKIIEKDEYGNN